jgi:hypothetical protein
MNHKNRSGSGQGIDRATFLRGSTALGLLAATGTAAGCGSDPDPPPGPPPAPSTLRQRSVCYDTGTLDFDGHMPRAHWRHPQVVSEIQAIRAQLHANTVNVMGSDHDRLIESATIAREQGLEVWVQPRLFDHAQPQLLEHIGEAARRAEALRRSQGGVTFNVGCEATLFVPGMVPGDNSFERIANLATSGPPPDMQRKLQVLLAQMLAAARTSFQGPVTYSAGEWEEVDWSGFDLVAVNLYRDESNQATYVQQLRDYAAAGKPLAITEFGCQTYEGADRGLGLPWELFDPTSSLPRFAGPPPTRSEQTQADYLTELLELFRREPVFHAAIYELVSPDLPHAAEAMRDLDRASHAITRVIRDDPADPASPYRWEPKQAFHAAARIYQSLSPA